MRNALCSPRLRCGVLALLCFTVVGCGSTVGDISGTVTYRGKPVTSGTLQFMPTNGAPVAVPIESDGTYRATVALGEAKVLVSTVDSDRIAALTQARSAAARDGQATRGSKAPPAPKAEPTYSSTPLKYSDYNKTDLKVTINPGQQTENFTLRD